MHNYNSSNNRTKTSSQTRLRKKLNAFYKYVSIYCVFTKNSIVLLFSSFAFQSSTISRRQNAIPRHLCCLWLFPKLSTSISVELSSLQFNSLPANYSQNGETKQFYSILRHKIVLQANSPFHLRVHPIICHERYLSHLGSWIMDGSRRKPSRIITTIQFTIITYSHELLGK